jgi:hypothetical protein
MRAVKPQTRGEGEGVREATCPACIAPDKANENGQDFFNMMCQKQLMTQPFLFMHNARY